MSPRERFKFTCPCEACGHRARSTETLYAHLYSRHIKRDVVQTLIKYMALLADIQERERYRERARK